MEATRMRGRSDGVKQAGVLFFYALVALVMTYPLVAHLTSGVLGPPGDNFEYLYKLSWFKRAVFDLGVSPFFTADVFHPRGYYLALHEMTLANISLGMPLTVLWGEIVSYNALVLLSFVLSGFGIYLLVYRLTQERLAALVSGVVFAFCSYRMGHLAAGHLNLLGTQWLPFLFLSLEQILESPRARTAILAGLFFALAALSSWYYAPSALIFGLVYVLWRARPWREHLRDRRLWLSFALSVVVAGLLMAPSMILTAQQWSQKDMAFSLRQVDSFSASVGDLFVPSVLHPLWGRLTAGYFGVRSNVPEYFISLSWVALALAVAALWRRRERVSSTYALLLGLGIILALGTTLHVGGQRVYVAVPPWVEKGFTAVMRLLATRLALKAMPSYFLLRVSGAVYVPLPTLLFYLYLPFFDSMRVWARFGLFAAFALAVLAGIGVDRLTRAADAPSPNSFRRRWLGWLCLAAVLFELASAPYPLGWSEVRSQPVDRWLAQQPGVGAVAEFPLEKAEHGQALYATRLYGKPVVYGYGAFYPGWYRQVRPTLWDFPTAESVALLREWGVRWILVGEKSYGTLWPDVERRLGQTEALHLVATFDEEPVYHSDWLAEALPDFGRAFIVDRVRVYELEGKARD